MKNKLVTVPTIKLPIQPSPGFAKKQLSNYHLDFAALCGFGCVYCSSNTGYSLRIHREEYADLTEEQTGERTYPATDPALMFVWPDVIERLEEQLSHKRDGFGSGQTIVVAMQTDLLSPELVKDGTARRGLELLIHKTAFRVRVLTKNAIVGSPEWVDYFRAHQERFVVGLSIGTLDDDWAKRIEVGTSTPSARLRALSALQAAGVSTYGMLCPMFGGVLEGGMLEALVDKTNTKATEHVWAEPFNDRINWRLVRDKFDPGSHDYNWLTRLFEKDRAAWSRYATDLYTRLRDKAEREGWIQKLRYLLYEESITAEDAPRFKGLAGVLLQSKPNETGDSRNPHIAKLQAAMRKEVP
jgi:DNA repair photolyase